MKNKNFAHLHVHSEYSLLDGYGKPSQYISKAKKMGFKYIAITDHGNIDGTIKWQKECQKQGIKSIIGSELYVVPDIDKKQKKEFRSHMVLLVKNKQGWNTLCSLLTKANLDGFYYKPRIDFKMLRNVDLSGLIVLTGCIGSFLKLERSERLLSYIKKKTDIYFEVMPHDISLQKDFYQEFEYLDLPLVATNDCHYIEFEQDEVQDILLAIQRKAKWDDPNRWKFEFRGLHLKSADEMISGFNKQGVLTKHQINNAMNNTIKIAEECCNFNIEKRDISLPDPPGFDHDENFDQALNDLCKMNVKTWNKKWHSRFEKEFQLIKKKGFAKYFLIVYDLINWCKRNHIMTGPGRGSVGGSLIAYLLGITKINPLDYNLSFSRFISEDRIDYPDIDIDFEDTKREEVRKYLIDTYGENNVCGISNFQTLKSRGVIRDVARVFNLPSRIVDEFAKSIPYLGDVSLEDSFKTSLGKNFKKKYPKPSFMALSLENQIRGVGQHAAGIIVSKEDLTKSGQGNLCVRNKNIVSNWDMADSEYIGLMKLDILGLRTLSILNECKHILEDKSAMEGYEEPFLFEDIPLDDNKVYEELSDGNTIGVFQLSARFSTEVLKKSGVKCLNDIAIVLALARPGPSHSGMTEDYIDRKKTKRWKKKNAIYEEVTKETFGLLIFQEQVIQVISKVAGLPEVTADKIRKIIGKKRDPKEFKQYEDKFIQGCFEQETLTPSEAKEFWSGLQEWASYGFNKIHATEYALLSYWTSWMKINNPAFFIIANLNNQTDEEKIQEFIDEAIRLGLKIMPPKHGLSKAREWELNGKTLYTPFIQLKGIGDKLVDECVNNKSKQKNKGFFIDEKEHNKPERKSLRRILDDIEAYNPDAIPDSLNKYLSFVIPKQSRARRRRRIRDDSH